MRAKIRLPADENVSNAHRREFNAVITGDVTQIDLPKGTRSGLIHVSKVLEGINEIGFTYFEATDVVRHRLVQKIVEAYDQFDRTSVSTLNSKDSQQANERDS